LPGSLSATAVPAVLERRCCVVGVRLDESTGPFSTFAMSVCDSKVTCGRIASLPCVEPKAIATMGTSASAKTAAILGKPMRIKSKFIESPRISDQSSGKPTQSLQNNYYNDR
jgi:hypothetical protein